MAKKQHNANTLYQKCMTGEERLTTNELQMYMDAPFALYCSYNVSEDERDYMLMQRQKEREQEKIKIKKKHLISMHIIRETPEQKFRRVIDDMFSGKSNIEFVSLYYKPEGMSCHVGSLEKAKGKSVFGNYHYMVKEIQGLVVVKKKQVSSVAKDNHILQIAFCNKILGFIQSYTPKQFTIINNNSEFEQCEYGKYKDRLEHCIAESMSIKRGDTIPPAIYEYDKQKPWVNYANKIAIENHDITQIMGISFNMRQRFIDAGYHNLKKISTSTPSKLCEIEKVGAKSAKEICGIAKAITTGKPVKLDTMQLPNTRTAIYLDLETTMSLNGEKTIDYLIGVLTAGKYKGFVAADLGGERKMMRAFLKYLEKFDDYTLYHWGSYDRTRLEGMTKRYKNSKEYQTHLYDLYAHSRKSWAFPFPGMSIKRVAKWMGFEWKHSDVDAREAGVLYQKYKKTKDKKAMKKMLDYNRDDCKAAMVVRDWLVTH